MTDYLTAVEAADHLGITEDELWLTKFKGMAPGSLGFRMGSDIMWRRDDLVPPPDQAPARSEGLECPWCGKSYKTERGFDNHVTAKHGE